MFVNFLKQLPLFKIPKSELAGIMGEINLLNHLDHRNIVKYLDNIKTKDFLNIVLEYCENGSLADTVKKFGSLPESLVAVYVQQVLEGLCYLHSQGVIHRDVKGANILTTKEGHVKLADFGVATRLEEGKANGCEDVAGTPYWMAPEVIEMSPASTAADVWSVGSTIVELLTGAPPYFELAAMAALFRIVQDPHPPIPEDISPALKDFLLHCFRKDPAARKTAKALLDHEWITASVARRSRGGVVRVQSGGTEGTGSGQQANGDGELAGSATAGTKGQDWTQVVERTLELHEAAQRERKSRGRIYSRRSEAGSTANGPSAPAAVSTGPLFGWRSVRLDQKASGAAASPPDDPSAWDMVRADSAAGGHGFGIGDPEGDELSEAGGCRPLRRSTRRRTKAALQASGSGLLPSSAMAALAEGQQSIWRRAMGLQPADQPLLDHAQAGRAEDVVENSASRAAVPDKAPIRQVQHQSKNTPHQASVRRSSPASAGSSPISSGVGPENPPPLYQRIQGSTVVDGVANVAKCEKGIGRWRDDDDDIEEGLELSVLGAGQMAARKGRLLYAKRIAFPTTLRLDDDENDIRERDDSAISDAGAARGGPGARGSDASMTGRESADMGGTWPSPPSVGGVGAGRDDVLIPALPSRVYRASPNTSPVNRDFGDLLRSPAALSGIDLDVEGFKGERSAVGSDVGFFPDNMILDAPAVAAPDFNPDPQKVYDDKETDLPVPDSSEMMVVEGSSLMAGSDLRIDLQRFVEDDDAEVQGAMVDLELPPVFNITSPGRRRPVVLRPEDYLGRQGASVGPALFAAQSALERRMERYVEKVEEDELLDLDLDDDEAKFPARATPGGPTAGALSSISGCAEPLQSVLERKLRLGASAAGSVVSGAAGDGGRFRATKDNDGHHGASSASEDAQSESDPFSMELATDLHGDEAAVVEGDMLRILKQLQDPAAESESEAQAVLCQDLELLLRQHGEQKYKLMVHHQVLPLLELMDSPSPLVVLQVIRVVHEAVTDRHRGGGGGGDYTGGIGIHGPLAENMCTVGLVPRLLALCSPSPPPQPPPPAPVGPGAGGRTPTAVAGYSAVDEEEWSMVRQHAALVLHSLLWGGGAHLVQTVVACQGIPALVGLLQSEPPLSYLALDCVWRVVTCPTTTPKLDYCRLLARAGAAKPLVTLLERAFAQERGGAGGGGGDDEAGAGWVDLAEEQADRVASVVLLFSQGDRVVKEDLARPAALEGVIRLVAAGAHGLPRALRGPFLKVLRGIRHLSGDTAFLEPLQNAGAVAALVPLLAAGDPSEYHPSHRPPAEEAGGKGAGGRGNRGSRWGPGVSSQVQSQALLALYNLCKISKVRQEQAAQAGVVPHLQRFIEAKDSPLRQLALPIYCDLAHASDAARAELARHDGLRFFLRLLQVQYWQQAAFNSVAAWLAAAPDAAGLEPQLLQPESIQALAAAIQTADAHASAGLLPPLLRVLQRPRVNRTLGASPLVPALLACLSHPDAVVRKGVLEVVQVLYEKTENPRAFIVSHDLVQVLERVVEEDGALLVQEQGRQLLRAMQVNDII